MHGINFCDINFGLLLLCCMLLQANAIGRSAKTVREYMEQNYSEEVVDSEEGCIKLALKALLEVVQSGSKNVELAIMERGKALKVRDNLR